MDYQIIPRVNKAGEPRFMVRMEICTNGIRKTVPGGTYGTEREAMEAGGKLKFQHESSTQKRQLFAGELTLEQWTTQWLNDLEVKDSTRMAYRYRLDKYILPSLGKMKLKDIDQLVIKRWLNGLPTRGIRKIAYAPLSISLNAAVALTLITHSPTAGLRVGGSKSQRAEDEEAARVKVWDYSEASKLLDAAVGRRGEPLVVLGLYGGLRPGEICALTWDKFDWLDGTILINRTLSTYNGKEYGGSTKSGVSRTVKLPFDAIQRLIRLQDASTTDRVYPIKKFDYAGRQLKTICNHAGVPYLNPHCLRHTCASMLLNQGIPVAVVAQILGHANSATTLKTYSHCLPSEASNATSVLEKALGMSPGPAPVGFGSVEAEKEAGGLE